MSLSNAFETLILQHLYQNANIANHGDATGLRGSTAAGSYYVGLHTADPGEAGTQSTSEATYTGYARVAVVRSAVGWTVSGNQASNAAVVNFGACTAGSSTVTHFTVGTTSTGVGDLIGAGALGASLAVTSGITPSFAIGALTTTAD